MGGERMPPPPFEKCSKLPSPLTFGSLFAGIGGLDLGLERAGLQCKWQVEIDDYCQRVLAKHWPNVRRWDDVRTFPPPEGSWEVDLICGGFPCQDISDAGPRIGIDGNRSGLWSEFARIIRHLRPRYVLVENVAALLVRGMDRVLGDLAACGYDAEWDVLPAYSFGAPHKRERIFIVAHTTKQRLQGKNGKNILRSCVTRSCWWHSEPSLGRVANGIPSRVDRLRGLGNAVVPQVAEYIGRRINDLADDSETERLR